MYLLYSIRLPNTSKTAPERQNTSPDALFFNVFYRRLFRGGQFFRVTQHSDYDVRGYEKKKKHSGNFFDFIEKFISQRLLFADDIGNVSVYLFIHELSQKFF